ncbi:uncharacterized protein METZ01_LOCUS343556 [marine metagenome]|uniref:Uncharacterized protein n=1 Tax=marine metagenome TaxID=408172 RepID=A0A382R0L1_9ZZZZ
MGRPVSSVTPSADGFCCVSRVAECGAHSAGIR